MIPILLCVSSLLWYRSRPIPLPTETPRPTSAVTPTVPPAKAASRWPSWSPDGKQIAYILIENNIPAINVYDLETGEHVTIFEDAHDIGTLEWSPVGDRIAFSARIADEDNFQIYAIHSDGSQLQRLTSDEQGGIFPTWSPDGEKIVYLVSNSTDNHTLILVINPDGSDQKLLTKAQFLSMPSFSPDREIIIFTTMGGSTSSRGLCGHQMENGSHTQSTLNFEVKFTSLILQIGQSLSSRTCPRRIGCSHGPQIAKRLLSGGASHLRKPSGKSTSSMWMGKTYDNSQTHPSMN